MTSAFAQTWDSCIDPANAAPRSIPFIVIRELNSLMHAATGIVGTTTYGGQNGPCFGPTPYTAEIAGGWGFGAGPEGSVQDQNPPDPNDIFIDDFMVHTWGMPFDPNRDGGLAITFRDGGTRQNLDSFTGFFNGQSGRYYQLSASHGDFDIVIRVDVIADTAKVTWTFTNTDTANQHSIGLWFGHTAAMLSANPDTNGVLSSFANLKFPGKLGFVELPNGRPPVVPRRFSRTTDPANFPEYINLLFGQSAAYGLRMDMGPTAGTQNAQGQSDATVVDDITMGTWLTSPNVFNANGAPDFIIPDTEMRNFTQILQKYNESVVQPLGTRRIVQYFRTPWGNGNYSEPYAAVVDAPQLIASDPDGQNGLRPNPMTFRIYVDNAQSLTPAGQAIALEQVEVKLTFPGAGLALSPGEPITGTKVIATIPPYQMSFVDFSVETDGIAFGDLPYKVEVTSATAVPRKVITGTVRVSTTPKLNLDVDANLVGVPWIVNDSSWEAVLGLQTPEDFRAYKWDPDQAGYVISTGIERGVGTWIVANSDLGVVDLQGNPTAPPDIASGAPNITLKPGWNLIANPYPYAVQLGQIIGVPMGSGVLTWQQLTQAGFINSALAYYDTATGDYAYVQGLDGTLFPHRGYWIYLNTQQIMTLSYPPVYARMLPGSTRVASSAWTQSANQWRLQLAARTATSQDAQNYVGVARSANEANLHRLNELPMSPVSNVGLSIEEVVNGSPRRMAQTLADRLARRTWRVFVNMTEQGTATITWPNLSTVPKNVRFKITDLATGTTRDLRQTSGYTFSAAGPTVREFRLEMIPGTAPKAVIGNVVVSRSRAPLAPFSIRYSLSSEATTTVRILSNVGKEVYSVHRGRADGNGENEVQWAMRDNANRLVAPGTYRVEILAETAEGERSRKMVPLNVIR